MAEKDLTARVRVQADDAQPLDKIERSLRDLDGAGRKAKGGLNEAATGADRADREIDQLKRQVRDLSRSLDRAKRDLEKFKRSGRGIDQLTKSVGGLKTAFAGLGIGLGVEAIRRGFGTLIETSRAQVDALAQVESALKSTGGAAGLTKPQLEEMASGLQKVTTFGDEVVLKMQSVLLTFKSVGSEIFPRASEVILDVATRLDTDLKTAAIQVGKALEDPVKGITSLGRAGVQFTDSQRDMIKRLVESGNKLEAQKIILGELETQFGGAARAARREFGGSLDAAKNAAGDLVEKIGEGGLTGALARLADRFTTSAEGSDDFATQIGQALGFVVEVVGGAITAIKAGLQTIAGVIGIGIAAIAEPFLELGATIGDALSNIPGLEQFGDRVKTQLGDLAGAVREFRHQTQRETEQNLRQARSSLKQTVDNIVDIWQGGAEKAKEEAKGYRDAANTAGESFEDLPPRVKKAVDQISTLLGKVPDDARAAAKDLQGAWETFDPEEVSERFERLGSSAQEALRRSFREAVETIRAAGGEISDEMLAIGRSIGVLGEVSPEVEAIISSIGEKLGALPLSAKKTAEDFQKAWEAFDANAVRQRFAVLDEKTQDEIRAQFAEAVSTIRNAGGEISEEMVLIGNSIGVLISAFEPVGSSANQAADAVATSTDRIAESIQVVVTKYDEAGNKIQSVEQITREAASKMTLEEIEQADPRLQEYVKRLKEAEEGLGQTSTVAKDAAEALSDPAEKVEEVSQNVGDLAGKSKDLANAQQEAGEAAKNQASSLGELAKALTSKDLSQSVADLAAKLEGLNQINLSPLLGQLDAVEQKARSVAQAVASIDQAADGAAVGEA